MDTKTEAHWNARFLDCAHCGRPLTNARYEGEFVYPLTIVYLSCRCKQLNEVTINVHDDFYNVATTIDHLPHQATKITQAPAMADTRN